MDHLAANRWIANHVVAFTAVIFYFVNVHYSTIKVSFFYYLSAYGLTFIGYHFIRKIDDKVSHETSVIEKWTLILCSIFLLPLLVHLPQSQIKWLMAICAILFSILYILPIAGFRLRNYVLTKSITITFTWIALFHYFLLPDPFIPNFSENARFYLYCIVLLLISCWAYDIQESKWSPKRVWLTKTICCMSIVALLIIHPTEISIKKGIVALLLLLYALHINKLQKCYHPRQNVWIDIFLGLNLLTLLL